MVGMGEIYWLGFPLIRARYVGGVGHGALGSSQSLQDGGGHSAARSTALSPVRSDMDGVTSRLRHEQIAPHASGSSRVVGTSAAAV